MTKDEAVALALSEFGGFNCAESIFLAGCRYLGIESDLIPKAATAFGGGLSRSRSVCGALAGAAMVLSVRYGRTVPSDDRSALTAGVQDLVGGFRGEFGSDNCYDITGIDFNITEGQAEYKDRVHSQTCSKVVEHCIRRALDLLD